MRKLLIICFYELKDYLASISEIFRIKYKWEVIAYPLYMYCYDKYSKIDNYVDHMSDFFRNENPDIVLWWFTDISTSIFLRIKEENPNTFYIIYNYSDPLNMNKLYLDRCTIFDHVITVCQQNQLIYKLQSKTEYVDFFPFGFDCDLFHHYDITKELAILDQKYMADISFICDSMYIDHHEQIIERKKLIDMVYAYCKTNNLIFNVYGPDFVSHYAKDSYKGDVKYNEIPSIAVLSKINIITHPNSRKKLGLCNPNLLPIMACGGIVLMDKINGSELFFNENKKVLFTFEKDSLLTKISEIISFYRNDSNTIDNIKSNAAMFSKQYSWEKFAEKIYLRYIQDRFDGEFYAKVYNVPVGTSIERMQNMWYTAHLKGEYQIPYKISIPSNFDMDNYRLKLIPKVDNVINVAVNVADMVNGDSDSDVNVVNVVNEINNNTNNKTNEIITDEKIYVHWYVNDKSTDYIKRGRTNDIELSGTAYNLPTTKLFDLFRGFNMMYVCGDLNTGLDILQLISKQNPRLKINDVLEKYINISYNE